MSKPRAEDRLTDADIQDLIREVLRGAPGGMDADSLIAAANLLIDVATKRETVRLLQNRELHGWVDSEGEVHLCVCGGGCDRGAQS